MKNDIEKGTLKQNQMHPYFVIKYQIFKILEQRGKINFSSNSNISQEYEIFNELQNVCNEKDEDDTKIDQSICKVYIPHNYHYMSQDKKEDHAKKYKMTLQQFEDKYINYMMDDDIIEKHINNGSLQTQASQTNNVKEIVSEKKDISIDLDNKSPNISDGEFDNTDDTDDSDGEIDKPKIDQKFLELTKEYNKKI
jgi:hypothetical protein